MEKRGTKKEREERRFRGIALLKQGWRGCVVAESLGVTQGAVSQWKSAYESKGLEGLHSKPHPGGQPKVPPEQLRKLPKFLLKGTRAYGFCTELWTLARVARVIEQKWKVRYHPAHVWRILRRLGWSCQKPERRARERNDQEVENWRSKEWPRIKKSPDN